MIKSYNQAAQKKPMLSNAAMRQAASFHKSKVVQALFNGSGKPNRPMSNLLDAAPRKLSKSDIHGLISLFRVPPKVWRDTQMWGAVAVEMLNPLFPFAKLDAAAKANRKLLGITDKDVNEKLLAPQFASVRLTQTGAEVSMPVVVFSDATIRHLAATATLPEKVTDFFAAGGLITATETTMRSVDLKAQYLDKKLQLLFRALGCVLRIHSTGGVYRLFLDFEVSAAQVEYMCNTDFHSARAIDLYGLVRTWCLGRTSTALGLPRSTRSLATIVATLPAGGEPRTDADGVLIDYNATILYLPKEVNNVERYDASLHESLLDANTGTVSQFTGTNVKTMPVAQSVLLDWVNKKWSYTDGSGNLTVMDLSRAQPLSFTHIRALVFGLVSTDVNTSFITKISAWSTRAGGKPFDNFQAFTSNAVTLINLNPDYEGDTAAQLSMYHIAELAQMHKNPDVRWASRLAEFEPYVNFCDNVSKVIADIKKDEDAYFMMTGNTVLGVSSTMAQAIVFDKWANKSDLVAAEDKKRRAKYTAAPIDPSYKIPNLPYVSVQGAITPGMTKEQIDHAKSLSRGLMPHQANVANQLRESPDYAILGVQAGGGKTMIIVTDILKEMQSGVKGPFLVLCPAHLVSQYVQEFTYTTNGRVNVVAVTTYTITNVGYPILQKMIESAPVNTVVVADYNMAKGGTKTLKVGYGTSSANVYRVVEFLRQFNFQYAACDESHKLKNQQATQTRAIATLIADVPKKRLASGTFMDNSVSDIAGQFALLDPTVFGSVEKFNERYSDSKSTGRITKLRPGAEIEIMNTLKSNSCYVQVKRKEWAAILPPRKEEMMFVDLTPNQRIMYEIIINGDEEKGEKGIVNSLKEEALKNDSLAKLLRLGKYANTSAEDAEADLGDLDEESNSDMLGGLDELLKPYLSRLEQFMVAPARDKLGSTLQGADRFSPKVAKLVEIFNKHVYEDEIPGKILVFTNQKASAEALYDGLPEDVKKRTIMYTAGRKEECGAEFATDDNKVMMIGVSSSMDTGLNLQFCFPGDTYVMTDYDKCAKLEDVYNTDSVTHVLSYDLESRKIERKPILQKTRNLVRAQDRYVAIKMRDLNTGVVTQQICTDNHQFILKGNKDVAAGELQPGNKLITYGGDFRKLKVEPQSGELVDSFTRTNTQCTECGDWFDGTAMAKHKATVHGIAVKRYEEIKVVRQNNSAERFEDDDYRIRFSSRMKEVSNTPESRKAMSERGLKAWEGNEERRAEASESSSKRWSDPEYKERVSASIAEFYATPKGKKLIDKLNKKSQEFWSSTEGKATRKANAENYWTPERRAAKGAEFVAMWADDDMRDMILDRMAETANDPELVKFKSKMTSWLHANVEGYTEKGISAMIRAQGTLPNKPERNVIDLGIKGLEYTGDGKYFVTLNFRGERKVKNPDFVSSNHSKNGRTRKVVEVIGCRDFTGRDAAYVADLKQAYAAIGIECLVIDAKYCYEDSERFDDVKPLLESFVNNHYLEVMSVREVTNKDQIGKYKYDITVEGNHNYFVVANLNGANAGARPTTPVLVHNCSRLVRAETVMSPGALEQGNARIGRPNLKDTEKRPATYYDWILVANSIDVTKVAYLMTKKVRIASVEEAGNPIFAELEVPELFSLSLENITVNNTRESLAPYLGSDGMYRKFLDLERDDYQDFRDRNPHLLNSDGKLKMVELHRSEDLPDSTIMRRVPYVPGLNIYGDKELGLVRLDQYLHIEVKSPEESEDDTIEGDDEDDIGADDILADDSVDTTAPGFNAKQASRQRRADFVTRVSDLLVHTDEGEGSIVGVNFHMGRVNVKLNNGTAITKSMLSTFVITKPTTSMSDVRGAIAKMAGDIPIDTPWEVKAGENVIVPAPAVVTKQKTTQHIDVSRTVELNLIVTNDLVGLEFSNLDDKRMYKTLKALKFTDSPQHYFAEFKTAQIMNRFFLAMLGKGYAIPKPQLLLLSSFYFNWKNKGAAKAESLFGMGTATQQRNFYVMNHKPNPDKMLATPYISCESSAVYLCLATASNKGNQNVVKNMHVTGVRFRLALPTLQRFFTSPSEAAAFVRTLMAQGYKISNAAELHGDFTRLRKEIPRATKKTMEQFYNEKDET